MANILLNIIKFIVNPPKEGDVFLGHPKNFVSNRAVESVLHGLKNINGISILEPINSKNCYRIVIESTSMPNYYRCSSEVLCRFSNNSKPNDIGIWMKRCQPRRISKNYLFDMVKSGLLTKGKKT